MVRFPPEQRAENHAAAPTCEDDLRRRRLPLGEDLRRAVEAWFAYLAHERGATDNTLDAYGRDLRQFLAWLKADLGHAPCLADLARLDAGAFAPSWPRAAAPALPAARWRAAMSALRAFFRWLEAQEIAGQPRRPAGGAAEGAARHSQAADGGEGGRRGRWRRGGRARLGGGARRGRAAAALRLRPAHLRGAGPARARRRPAPAAIVLRIVGKGGKERLVPVLPVAQAAIARYMDALPLSRSSPTARCSSAPRAAA